MPEEIITVFKVEVEEAVRRIKEVRSNLELTEEAEKELAKEFEEAGKKQKDWFDPKSVDTYGKEIDRAKDKAKEFGKVSNEAFRVLDKITFGAAGKIRELYQGIVTLTRGMKVLRAALIGTGIGALVVAIGSLIAYFTQTQRGADALKRVFAGLGAAVQVLTNKFIAIGESIIEAFENPKQAITDLVEFIKTNLVNRVKALPLFFIAIGKSIKEGLTGNFDAAGQAAKDAGHAFIQFQTGLDTEQQKKFANAVGDTAKEMRDAANAGTSLEGTLQKIRDAEIKLSLQRAQSRAQIKELNFIAEDTTKTEAERIAAVQQALAIEQKLLSDQIALQEQKVEAIRAQNALGNDLIENTQDLTDAEIELANMREQSFDLQTNLRNKENAIKEQSRMKDMKAEEALAEAVLAVRQRALDMTEAMAEQEQLMFDQLFANKQITEERYNQKSLEIGLTRIRRLMSLEEVGSLEYERLLAEKAALESEFADKGVTISEKANAERLANAESAFKKELLAQEEKFLKGEQSERQYLEAVRNINLRRVDALLADEEKGSERYQELMTERARIDKEYYDQKDALRDADQAEEDEAAERAKERAQKALDESVNLISTIAEFEEQQSQERLDRLTEQGEQNTIAHQAEISRINALLETATGADRERLLSMRRAQIGLIRIEQQQTAQAIAEEKKRIADFKKAQLVVMTIQEAVALARAFSDLGPVAGPIAAIALAAKFAILLSQIENASFAKGTDYLQRGSNKPGVDTIPIWANEGEAIIPTDRNREHPGMAKAWIKGDLDQYINKNYVLPRLGNLMELHQRNQAAQRALVNNTIRGNEVTNLLNDRNIVAGLRELGRVGKRSSERTADRIVDALNQKSKNRGT